MRFLHSADWQIGMKASSLGDKASAVRMMRLQSARRVVETAARERADFLLLAGDTFEDNAIDRLSIRETARILGAAPCPVYLIPGNHDPVLPGSVWEDPAWSEFPNVHPLLDRAPVAMPGGVLYPCPLFESHSTADPTEWIPPRTGAEIRIGLAHGTVESHADLEFTHPIPRDAAQRRGLDYLALGHIHSVRTYAGAAYSGAHEATRFGEDRSGYVLVVEIAAAGAAPEIQPVRTGTLDWRQIRRDIRQPGELAAMLAELEQVAAPETVLIDCAVTGTLFAAEHEIAARLVETVEGRFVYGRADLARLIPEDRDPAWIEELPGGYLRDAARDLLDAARGTPPDAAAALALREYGRLWQEVRQ